SSSSPPVSPSGGVWPSRRGIGAPLKALTTYARFVPELVAEQVRVLLELSGGIYVVKKILLSNVFEGLSDFSPCHSGRFSISFQPGALDGTTAFVSDVTSIRSESRKIVALSYCACVFRVNGCKSRIE